MKTQHIDWEEKKETLRPKTFRLSPEARRAVYYLALPCFILPILLFPLFKMTYAPHHWSHVLWSLLIPVPGILLIFFTRYWRVGFDKDGLYRRCPGFCTRWPWEDFYAGHICLEGNTLRNTRPIFWKGFINLDIAPEERQELLETCLPFWHEPVAKLPEDKITLSVRFERKKHRVVLNQEGIVIQRRKSQRQFAWELVKAVHFLTDHRMQQCCSPVRVQFEDFFLDLPPLLNVYTWVVQHVSEARIERYSDEYRKEQLEALKQEKRKGRYYPYLTVIYSIFATIVLFRPILNHPEQLWTEFITWPCSVQLVFVFTMTMVLVLFLLVVPFIFLFLYRDTQKAIDSLKDENPDI